MVGRLLANRTASPFSGVAGMPRNQGLASVGITGCFASEGPAGIRRNTHDILKSEMGLEHSRHRSVTNAMVHVLSCLVAYAFRPGKPSISLKAQQIEA